MFDFILLISPQIQSRRSIRKQPIELNSPQVDSQKEKRKAKKKRKTQNILISCMYFFDQIVRLLKAILTLLSHEEHGLDFTFIGEDQKKEFEEEPQEKQQLFVGWEAVEWLDYNFKLRSREKARFLMQCLLDQELIRLVFMFVLFFLYLLSPQFPYLYFRREKKSRSRAIKGSKNRKASSHPLDLFQDSQSAFYEICRESAKQKTPQPVLKWTKEDYLPFNLPQSTTFSPFISFCRAALLHEPQTLLLLISLLPSRPLSFFACVRDIFPPSSPFNVHFYGFLEKAIHFEFLSQYESSEHSIFRGETFGSKVCSDIDLFSFFPDISLLDGCLTDLGHPPARPGGSPQRVCFTSSSQWRN